MSGTTTTTRPPGFRKLSTARWYLELQDSRGRIVDLGAFLTDTDDDRTSGTRFPWDYALAELGPLQQFNPVKVFIDVMATVHCFSCCRLTVELRFIGRVLNRLACML